MFDQKVRRPHGHPAKFTPTGEWDDAVCFKLGASLLKIIKSLGLRNPELIEQALLVEDRHGTYPNRDTIEFAVMAVPIDGPRKKIFVHPRLRNHGWGLFQGMDSLLLRGRQAGGPGCTPTAECFDGGPHTSP